MRGYQAAQAAYDAAEPEERSEADVGIGRGSTLARLAHVLDEHGIRDLRVSMRGPSYTATARTRDAEGESVAIDLARAISGAVADAAAQQRAIDDGVGS